MTRASGSYQVYPEFHLGLTRDFLLTTYDEQLRVSVSFSNSSTCFLSQRPLSRRVLPRTRRESFFSLIICSYTMGGQLVLPAYACHTATYRVSIFMFFLSQTCSYCSFYLFVHLIHKSTHFGSLPTWATFQFSDPFTNAALCLDLSARAVVSVHPHQLGSRRQGRHLPNTAVNPRNPLCRAHPFLIFTTSQIRFVGSQLSWKYVKMVCILHSGINPSLRDVAINTTALLRVCVSWVCQ